MAQAINGMVDNSAKENTRRIARASGSLTLGSKAYRLLMKKGSPKGDVFETAKIAGVMAAKQTPSIIPLCHLLEINKVALTFKNDPKKFRIMAEAEVVYVGKTGVEMEALTAVAAALLTIYDMMKWADKGMVLSEIKLLHKSGGKSGTFNRT